MRSVSSSMLPRVVVAVVGSGKNGRAIIVGVCLFLVSVVPSAWGAFTTTSTSSIPGSPFASSSSSSLYANRRLGLLSFDLDDTLFPTGQVVRAANEVMMEALLGYGCEGATIPTFLETTKAIRKTLTEPLTYRDLRKRSIRQTLVEKSPNYSREEESRLETVVDECYSAWVSERHAAAERFIFDDAIDTLRILRETFPETTIVAITNGAGDPLVMPNTLAPFFDLRVSGEDEQVFPHRKPHPFIYEYTLQQCEGSMVEGNVWCHVGDCLANDVGASASCGAQAIWMCMDEDEESAASRLVDTKRVPEWSTASTSELEKRAQQVELGKKAVAAKIAKLSDLPEAIQGVLGNTRVLSGR